MSRHGLASRRSRPGNEVVTWPGVGQGREVATCAHDMGATRPVHAEHATCAGCERDMRATGWLCAQQRPRPGHYARSVRATWFLGVCTMHTAQFCDSALFKVTVWALFMDTVHEHCS